MGTNYYIRENNCESCGRFNEEHIGKSSAWWDFTIRHHRDKYNSFSEFKEYIKDKKIFDEYSEEMNHKVFLKFLAIKKKDYPFAHNKAEDTNWSYIDGYYFLNAEFS